MNGSDQTEGQMKAQIICTIETFNEDGSEQKEQPTPFQIVERALPWFTSAVEGAVCGVNDAAEAKGAKVRAKTSWETVNDEKIRGRESALADAVKMLEQCRDQFIALPDGFGEAMPAGLTPLIHRLIAAVAVPKAG